MKKIQGFTLVELIIAIAIVGVLAAIAMQSYANHMAQTRINVAISELNGGKPQYELILIDASVSGSNIFTVKNMFFSNESEFCLYGVNAPDNLGNSNHALICELKNSASLNGKSVYFNRSASGKWSCSTSADIPEKYKPVSCR